jgi:hypothetical protein
MEQMTSKRLRTEHLWLMPYNPSYSGCRDQEDSGSKPAQANSSVRPYIEKPFTKIGLVE